MIHELTHLIVPNHGSQFKAYMDKFYPNWREVRKLLNQQAHY
jgi:predicted metal-dependent hydrolase